MVEFLAEPSMNHRRPTWTLAKACPVCGQGSALVLVACPGCAWVAVHCDEEGTYFLDPRSLLVCDQRDSCPDCEQHILAEFETASDVQLERAGLTREDYA